MHLFQIKIDTLSMVIFEDLTCRLKCSDMIVALTQEQKSCHIPPTLYFQGSVHPYYNLHGFSLTTWSLAIQIAPILRFETEFPAATTTQWRVVSIIKALGFGQGTSA